MLAHESRQLPSWLISDVGQKMKRIIASLVIFSASAAFSATSDAWIVSPPPTAVAAKKIEIPVSDVFEVVTSMAEHAQSALHKKTFVPLSEQHARMFTGHYYSCPDGKRPFLVRAVAGFAGTGAFHVSRLGDAVWISHESLGEEFISSRTALVVNLDFTPTAAYASVSIIR